jgi:pimeloyl-ACP methyl ester carboxylesterase
LHTSLGERRRVIAPDLIGYGDAPDWADDRSLTLEDEVRRFDALFEECRSGLHLVGHSYGGAVALRAALRHPQKVRSVTVYEPVLFGLLEQLEPGGAALVEVWRIAGEVLERFIAGDSPGAAEAFVDYWNGAGAWSRLPDWQRVAIARRMGKTTRDFVACFGDPMTLEDMAALPMPVLCLQGGYAPDSTRTICHWLIGEAGFRSGRIEVAGHLGPMTHALEVNALIHDFVDRVDGTPGRAEMPTIHHQSFEETRT